MARRFLLRGRCCAVRCGRREDVRAASGASCVVAFGAGRGFSLGRNGGCAGGYLVRIARVVVAHEAEAVVEFEDVGCGRGDVDADDLAVGKSFHLFDDAAQRIAVRRGASVREIRCSTSRVWSVRRCRAATRWPAAARGARRRSAGRNADAADRRLRAAPEPCRSCGARPAPALRRSVRLFRSCRAPARLRSAFRSAATSFLPGSTPGRGGGARGRGCGRPASGRRRRLCRRRIPPRGAVRPRGPPPRCRAA